MFKKIMLLVCGTCFVSTIHAAPSTPTPAKPYNIILIISDQEAYQLYNPSNYSLPAREEIRKHGITFTQHYTAAAMCSPSRATLLTGLAPQTHGIFDQEEYSYVPELSTSLPNMGSQLKKLGYRTAYFGKFEMNKSLLKISDKTNYSTLATPYGFDVFNYDGDVGGEPQQGYTHDPYFIGEAVRWLRKNGKSSEKTPFFVVVSLLNPHDIMYGDANLPNTPQDQKPQSPVIMPPPSNSIYAKKWQFTLPQSLEESLSAKGMPSGLKEYQQGWGGALGFIPTARKDMWQYYYNYYLNSIRDNDTHLQNLVKTLNDMNLWGNTIIIFTADHGEMGGSHGGLRGKGPFAYEENSHIPLIIAHPKAPKNVNCAALTSHIDMLPTLIGLTGLANTTLLQQFPGHDFSSLLTHPQEAKVNEIRPGILFNYVGISTIDGNYLLNTLVSSFSHHTLPSLSQVNLTKRGFLSFVFDGRYKFARYYSPNLFNTPNTFEEIFKNNDVQLFDLKTDPNELHNLALEREKYKSIILHMNELLNNLMAKEVKQNTNAFLPAEIRGKNVSS